TYSLAGLQKAARQAPGPAAAQKGPVASNALVQSLRASGALINAKQGVPRVVLITDLRQSELPAFAKREDARAAGFKQGRETALDFGRADVLVMQPGGGDAMLRDYMDAFLLSQHGRLAFWGDFRTGVLPEAPVRVERYVGEATYPQGPETIQVRVGIDKNGA